jgi:hypothetical protein
MGNWRHRPISTGPIHHPGALILSLSKDEGGLAAATSWLDRLTMSALGWRQRTKGTYGQGAPRLDDAGPTHQLPKPSS